MMKKTKTQSPISQARVIKNSEKKLTGSSMKIK